MTIKGAMTFEIPSGQCIGADLGWAVNDIVCPLLKPYVYYV